LDRRIIRVALGLAFAVLLAVPGAWGQIPHEELMDEFAHCADWYQAPDQPGTSVVTCDQEQLDHFMASGLTDPGPGGARIDGPDGREHGAPAVYTSEVPYDLPKVRIIGSGSMTGAYVATLGYDGVLREATFPATTLPNQVRLQVRRMPGTAKLVTASGDVIATAPLMTTRLSRFHVLPLPKGVHARRIGAQVVVSWLARPRTGYKISAGPTRGAAGVYVIRYVSAGAGGRRRASVSLPKSNRWIGVRALGSDATSRLAPTRIR
jgi:hypothetical protein